MSNLATATMGVKRTWDAADLDVDAFDEPQPPMCCRPHVHLAPAWSAAVVDDRCHLHEDTFSDEYGINNEYGTHHTKMSGRIIKQARWALREARSAQVRQHIMYTVMGRFSMNQFDECDPRYEKGCEVQWIDWCDLPHWVRHAHDVAHSVHLSTFEIKQLFRNDKVHDPEAIQKLGDCLRARNLNFFLQMDIEDIGLTSEECHREGVFVTPFDVCDGTDCQCAQCQRRSWLRCHPCL